MNRIIVMLVCAGVPLLSSAESPKPIKLEEFAYGLTANPESGHAMYRAPIPGQVYRNTVRKNLGDIRMFNADREAIPYMIRRYAPLNETIAQSHLAILTPIFGRKDQHYNDIELKYRSTPGRMAVTIYNRDMPTATDTRQPKYYVASLDSLKRPINKLKLNWSPGQSAFIHRAIVDVSDNLRNWRTVSQNAVIAELFSSSNRAQHNDIPVAEFKAKYMRVRVEGEGALPMLSSVNYYEKPEAASPAHQWQQQALRKDKRNEYLIDTGGHMPVDRIRITLPQENSVVRARVYSRNDIKRPWHMLAAATIYKLYNNGQSIKHEVLKVHRTKDRYLRLVIDNADSAIGTKLPEFEIGWVPEDIVFLARGPGPYTLAYGHRGAQREHHVIGELLNPQRDGQVVTPKLTSFDVPHEIGGAGRVEPLREVPWKRWMLWAVLLLSVVILSWMAMRLAKQLKKEGD